MEKHPWGFRPSQAPGTLGCGPPASVALTARRPSRGAQGGVRSFQACAHIRPRREGACWAEGACCPLRRWAVPWGASGMCRRALLGPTSFHGCSAQLACSPGPAGSAFRGRRGPRVPAPGSWVPPEVARPLRAHGTPLRAPLALPCAVRCFGVRLSVSPSLRLVSVSLLGAWKPLAQSDSVSAQRTPAFVPVTPVFRLSMVGFLFFLNTRKHSSAVNRLGCVEPRSVVQRVVSALVSLGPYPSFSLLPRGSCVLGHVALRGST